MALDSSAAIDSATKAMQEAQDKQTELLTLNLEASTAMAYLSAAQDVAKKIRG